MYNGIGIQSTRGTGTSGHVQRNIAALNRVHRRRTSKPNPNDTLRAAFLRKSGVAQRAHEARRRVEVAVAELEEELGARGYDADTIAEMAQRLREDLLNREEDERKGERDRELEEKANRTDLTEHRNEKLRNVLGVEKGYVEGAGFRNMRPREQEKKTEGLSGGEVAVAKSGEDGKKETSKDVLRDSGKEEITAKDVALKNAVAKDASANHEPGVQKKLNIAYSDTESSALSESSDESDSDESSKLTDKGREEEAGAGALNTEQTSPPITAGKADRKVEHLPETNWESREAETRNATRSPERNAVRSHVGTPPPRNSERFRGRPPSTSPSSRGSSRVSPYRRSLSPRYREPSPNDRGGMPYDRHLFPRRHGPSRYSRSPTPPKHDRARSPPDRSPSSDGYHDATYLRHRQGRSSFRRSSRRRSPSRDRGRYTRYRDDSVDSLSTLSRSASPHRRRAYSPYGRRSDSPYRQRDDSPRKRNADMQRERRPDSPYERRGDSPYGQRGDSRAKPRYERQRRSDSPLYGRYSDSSDGRSLSPPRRSSRYERASPGPRSISPYSRKRKYPEYGSSRRVRYRRQSPHRQRYGGSSERRRRRYGYSSSDSDSSLSPPRHRTPPKQGNPPTQRTRQRRSRFSDYRRPQSQADSAARMGPYSASPAD